MLPCEFALGFRRHFKDFQDYRRPRTTTMLSASPVEQISRRAA